MKKKLLSLVLLLGMLLSLQPLEAFAAAEPDILLRVEEVTGQAGQTVQAGVYLEGGTLPAGVNFSIRFDPAFLRAEAADRGPILRTDDYFFESHNISGEPGTILVAAAADQPLARNGLLCTLTFTVLETIRGDAVLTVEQARAYTAGGAAIPVTAQNGAVRLTPRLWLTGGQVNGKGEATVQVVLESLGAVRSGALTLGFAPADCRLKTASSAFGTVQKAADSVSLTWDGTGKTAASEVLLTLTFDVKNPVGALTLRDVTLKDASGQSMPGGELRSGSFRPAGIPLQKPEAAQTVWQEQGVWQTVRCELKLALAGSAAPEQLQVWVTFFNGGRMSGSLTVAADKVHFDRNGFAVVPVEASCRAAADAAKIFVIRGGGYLPCTEAIRLDRVS